MPLTAAVLLPLLAACAVPLVPEEQPTVQPDGFLRLDMTTFDQLPGWKGDRLSDALPVFLGSCEKLKALPPKHRLKPAIVPSRISDWLPICEAAAKVSPGNEIAARYF